MGFVTINGILVHTSCIKLQPTKKPITYKIQYDNNNNPSRKDRENKTKH